MADEERLLAALTLLDRADLDRRIGTRVIGPYVIDVERPERALYRLSIGRQETRDVEDLVTVVYRQELPRAQ